MNPHSISLLHLLDALTAHGLVIEQGSTHLSQPSVNGRRQWRVTWPAVRVVLQIRGLKVRHTDADIESDSWKTYRFPNDLGHSHVEG